MAVATTACADDGPASRTSASTATVPTTAAPVQVVAVTSQRCQRPMLHHGVGTRLGGDRVLTAAHVVDGDLRRLEVDGVSATVVGLDARLDLAVLERSSAAPQALTEAVPPPAFSVDGVASDDVVAIATPSGTTTAAVARTVTLRVDDVDDGVVHEREAIQLAGAVARGTSGAPVLDETGAIVGVVLLSDPIGDVTYAVRLPSGVDPIGPAPFRRGCTRE